MEVSGGIHETAGAQYQDTRSIGSQSIEEEKRNGTPHRTGPRWNVTYKSYGIDECSYPQEDPGSDENPIDHETCPLPARPLSPSQQDLYTKQQRESEKAQ